MSLRFDHAPVMVARVLDQIRCAGAPRVVVDVTVGGGGHAQALLEAFADLRLLGIDRDPDAVAATRARLAPFGARAEILHGRFSQLPHLLAGRGVTRVDGLVADLGVSSHQLDNAARGFSFRERGPLDMRMDPSTGPSASELLGSIPEAHLARAIASFGEERYARRVARAVKAALPADTLALAETVRAALPKRGKQRIDPATRTFQAIRMLLNEEVAELRALLAVVPELLADRGVAVVIAFHSLEDRAVKRAFRTAAMDCICPPSTPVCICAHEPTLTLLTRRPIQPGPSEIDENRRARSAKLRAAQRLPRPT